MVPLLRPFFHREVPAGGNYHTASVSRYVLSHLEQDKVFKGLYTANYKQVVALGAKDNANSGTDLTLMTIDTGMSGNPFSPHYFSMHADHATGNLHRIPTDFEELAKGSNGSRETRSYLLTIRPKKVNKNEAAYLQ